MQLDYQKELTPVLYGDTAVKIIKHTMRSAGKICFSMHWHDRMEILIVHSGSLLVNIGDAGFEVKTGQLAVFPPCVPHFAVAGADGVLYDAVMFDISKFFNSTGASPRLLEPLHSQRVLFHSVVDDSETVSTAKKILALHDTADEGFELIAIGEVYRLIGLLYKNWLSQQQMSQPDCGRFKEILDYIGSSFCDDISSSSLSRKFGYDETYFCRRFKTVTGLTPTVYIRILRLEKAKKLIKEGTASIADTASVCGFSDSGYFSRCFKKHFGITPAEYSLKYRK